MWVGLDFVSGIVMLMLGLLAHGTEVKETAGQSISHRLQDDWYLALMVFILGMYVVIRLTYYLSGKSKAATMNITLGALFVVGVLTYQYSTVVSVFALTAGFGLALFTVITNLSSTKSHAQK